MRVPDDPQLLDDIAHGHGQSKSLKSLYALYGLKGQARVTLRRNVQRLVQTGRLVRLRGAELYAIPRERTVLTGVLAGTTRGFAFVAPDEPALPDVFIPEKMLRGALHGDRVEVSLLPDSAADRPAGRVTAIVERRSELVVGLYLADDRGGSGRVIPFDPRLSVEIVVPERFSLDAEDGTCVEVRLLHESRRGSDGALPARVVSVLGRPEEKGTDLRVVLRAFGLTETHAPAAVAEAERAASRGIDAAEVARRRDMRGMRTVTIDGETARDFDDAVSIERLANGRARLHVHVADVSAHVAEGTRLDAEAWERATSVYLPDRALHMLPEALAAGACSLRPGEDKLTMTATLEVDLQGEVHRTEFCESVIRSDRRMTYTDMKRLLVDRDEKLRAEHAEHLDDFELMAQVAAGLTRARLRRGGLDFDLPEPLLTLDADGLPIAIGESERNVAHRLIEEFMIAANSAVARKLEDAGMPSLHRIHEPPAPDRIAAFRAAARALGYEVEESEQVGPEDFSKVLRAAEGKPEERFLTMLALRTMALARYAVQPVGHFGLALRHYTHFTSPIRRYPDLVVHRTLKRLLAGERTAPEDLADVEADLAEDGSHCSRAERKAAAAERALVEWKVALYMKGRIGDEFGGHVSAVSERGLQVVLDGHGVEAFLPTTGLSPDRWERADDGLSLRARSSGRVVRLGDALRVRVARADVFRRKVELTEVR